MTGNGAMADAAALIEPLIPALRRYAYGLLRDRAAADDLVQDALERAIGRWSQRRPDRNARSWMFAIVHNLAINRMRQRARRGAHMPIDDVEEAAFAHPPTQEIALRHREVLAAMDTLPPDQKGILLMVSVEGLSYAEVAEALGTPLGTVMSRLARAREKLLRLADADPTDSGARRPHLRRVK
jgi:RNA polymerase sigma factor (sigma-70 family)